MFVCVWRREREGEREAEGKREREKGGRGRGREIIEWFTKFYGNTQEEISSFSGTNYSNHPCQYTVNFFSWYNIAIETLKWLATLTQIQLFLFYKP